MLSHATPHLKAAKALAPSAYISGLEGGNAFLAALIGLARDLKANPKALIGANPLAGKVFTGLFLNPSLRTRTSFEVAMSRLGGHMVTLTPGSGAWAVEFERGAVMDGGCAEHIIEAAGVLSGYSDLVGMRAFASMQDFEADMKDTPIKALAQHATTPVVSLESAMWHPCQALADAMTLIEHFGGQAKGKKFVLTWTRHPRSCGVAVPHSALVTAARLGMDVTLAHPPAYALHPDAIDAAQAHAAESGGSLTLVDDIDAACEGADVVYAKAWAAPCDYGDPAAASARNMSYEAWTVTPRHLGEGAFMHCLPVRRNVVVTDAVLDGPSSLVQQQANNRLWAQMALALAMIK